MHRLRKPRERSSRTLDDVNCPICSHDTRVLRTDDTERKRECTCCGHRFTTAEILKVELERSQRIIEDAKALAERIKAAA